MRKLEFENCYKEDGEQIFTPIKMLEPMYLVARSIVNRGEKQDCVLKKHDVVKFGRVRFKVQTIKVSNLIQRHNQKKEKLLERKKAWEEKVKESFANMGIKKIAS